MRRLSSSTPSRPFCPWQSTDGLEDAGSGGEPLPALRRDDLLRLDQQGICLRDMRRPQAL